MPDTDCMGRHKGFSREDVLEKALPIFWKQGFADTSLQNLEQATGVRKSGLYAEFKDKADLFVESLRHYLETQQQRQLLESQPLGWKNIERFLKLAPIDDAETKGCFSVNSIRELPILPEGAEAIITQSRRDIRRAIAANLKAAIPKLSDSDAFAEIILTFFTGDSLEANLKPNKPYRNRKIDRFLAMVRSNCEHPIKP